MVGRFAVAILVGLAAWMLPIKGLPQTRLLGCWDTGVFVFVVMAWTTITRFDARSTRAHAKAMDVSGFVIFLAALAAALASLGAIVSLAMDAKEAAAGTRSAHVAVSLLALLLSWMLIHTLFTFRYARRYYGPPVGPDPGGMKFPGSAEPDYRDFSYYSFVVGMTSQVSDVQVTSHSMRRLTLVHGVLSFFFNLVALALCVNIVAGLF